MTAAGIENPESLERRRKMKIVTSVLASCLAFALSALGQTLELAGSAAPFSETVSPDYFLASWQNGLTVQVANSGVVQTFDDRGGRKHWITPAIPGAGWSRTRDAAVAPDGSIAIVGSAHSPQGATSAFLLLYDAAGKLTKAVRLRPFAPYTIRYAPDGTLWAVGREYDDNFVALPVHNMVRRYSSSGVLLGSYVSTSLFGDPRKQHPARKAFLATAGTRVAVLFDGAGEWVELDREGDIAGRWRLSLTPDAATLISGISITESGDAFLSTQTDEQDKNRSLYRTLFRFYRLDRGAGRFVEQALPGVDGLEPVRFVGSNGANLVVSTKPLAVLQLRPR